MGEKSEKWLEGKGVHPFEPIYWETIDQSISLEELLEMYASDSLKGQIEKSSVSQNTNNDTQWIHIGDQPAPKDRVITMWHKELGKMKVRHDPAIRPFGKEKYWEGVKSGINHHELRFYPYWTECLQAPPKE